MSQWSITTPAAIFPITLKEALDQARIDDVEANRSWVNSAIADATAYAETATQLSLITRTITAQYFIERDNVPAQSLPFAPYTQLLLFRGPVQTITSVKDRAGNSVSYDRRKVGNAEFVQLMESVVGPVTVVYVAGYGDTADKVPADIRRAIVAHVAHMWRNRGADADSAPTGLAIIYDKYQTGGCG